MEYNVIHLFLLLFIFIYILILILLIVFFIRSTEEVILERELDMVYKEILIRKKDTNIRNVSR